MRVRHVLAGLLAVFALLCGWIVFGTTLEEPEAIIVRSIWLDAPSMTVNGTLGSSARSFHKAEYRAESGAGYIKVYGRLVTPFSGSRRSGDFEVHIEDTAGMLGLYLEGRRHSPLLIWGAGG